MSTVDKRAITPIAFVAIGFAAIVYPRCKRGCETFAEQHLITHGLELVVTPEGEK